MMKWRFSAVLACLVLLSTTIAGADVVSEWNAVMLTTMGGQNPFAQARTAAITQIAVFEAVNAITKRYKPYLGTIDASRKAHPEAAAVAAAYRVLATYFPANLAALDSARAASLALISDGTAKAEGIAVGEAAAAAIIAARANDGSTPPALYLPPPLSAGEWQLTPSCVGGGAFFHWGQVTPFVIETAAQFRSDPPPELTSYKYARDLNEVKEVGDKNSTERPQDRTDVARYYAAVAAPAVWNLVAEQVVAARRLGLSATARAYALLNIAIADASITVFETKYHYNFWRPETAIANADLDGNAHTDPAPFTPLIAAPCFPSFPSGHGSLSNAAREVLESLFGGHRHAITLSSATLGLTLRYSRLKQITDDIADARVYGGIHFRFDQEFGEEQGRKVGDYVRRHALRLARFTDDEN